MYAALATVSITDYEKARRILHDDVLPTVSEIPGFVSGHWLAPVDGRGLSILIFETDGEARAIVAGHPRVVDHRPHRWGESFRSRRRQGARRSPRPAPPARGDGC
jgi:hypothetical protein